MSRIVINTNLKEYGELVDLLGEIVEDLRETIVDLTETIEQVNNFEIKISTGYDKAPEVEAQELSNQICNGQKTLNQAREELGLEPLEECDKLFTTAQCCKKCED